MNSKPKANPSSTIDLPRYLSQHPLLAQLINQNELVYRCDGDAPPPCKDYSQLEIHLDKVVLRWWRISIRNSEGSVYPNEIRNTYEDFFHDEAARREIFRIFGQRTLDYCLNLVQGHIDWLTRLPLKIQIKILSYLNLDDIPQLALVSKLFRSLCRNNDLWKLFYRRQHGPQAMENDDLVRLAERRGWRHIFFTNKLKLQMELRRESRLERYHPEDPSDLMKARENRPIYQPTAPWTPHPSSLGRHSFVLRKDRLNVPTLPNRDGSTRSQLDNTGEFLQETSKSSSVRR